MAVDVKQYIDQLAQTAGLSEEEKTNLLKVAANEKFAKGLEENILLRSDYSRNMDSLKAEKDKWTKWYTDTLAQTQANQKLVADYEAKVKAFEQQYGALDTTTTTHQVQDVFGKTEVEKLLNEKLQQQTNSMITVMEWLGQKPIEHYKTFGEPMDVSAIKKLAVEKGYSLDQAYAEYSGPLQQARQAAEVEAKIKAAREEGAREFASTHKMPIDARPREHHLIFDRKQDVQPVSERERAAAFAESWNSAGTTSGG
jgi:hypothetical protein